MEQARGKHAYGFELLTRFVHRWWGGVGCRISFFMAAALVFSTALVGAYFFWEHQQLHIAQTQNRALLLANELASLTRDQLRAGNARAVKHSFDVHLSHDEFIPRNDILYLLAYDRSGKVLAVDTAQGVDPQSISPMTARGKDESGAFTPQPGIPSSTALSLFALRLPSVYDLIVPVGQGDATAGYIRVGISYATLSERYTAMARRGVVVLVAILFVAAIFSQLIAIGITRPLLRINNAAEQLGRQNWDIVLPVNGRDEIANLARTFNTMALVLRQRESSLSDWNRDLFILHTAGLDLMESLDLGSLASRIANRAEDLVHADTVALVMVERNTGMLQYLRISGAKSDLLAQRDLPLEAGGIYNWLASYGNPLLVSDASADFRLDPETMSAMGIRCLMAVPMWSANQMLGILTAYNKRGGACFDKHDLRLFTVFSGMAGSALQNASLFTDLTRNMAELKDMQEQLVHTSKMAAIGELAANVAHEVNNPLTGVLGYTSHLLKTVPLQDDAKRILGMMEQETLRVRKIIRNLLDFARHRPSRMEPGDLLVPLKGSLALLQGMADAASVRISEDYPAAPVIVNMDQNEIKQVFINIMYNALQAMPKGGSLRVRIGNGPDQEAVVEIEDSGIGIPKENLDKIFEPFFSTKESGQGTGLGLSISYRIVRDHCGKIAVESTVGSGTLFRVCLPLHQGAGVLPQFVRSEGRA